MSRIEVEAEVLAIGLAAVAGLYYLYQARPTFDNLARVTNTATGVLADGVDWLASGHVLADTGAAISDAADWVELEASEAANWAEDEAIDIYSTASGAISSAYNSVEQSVENTYNQAATAVGDAIDSAEQAVVNEANEVWDEITGVEDRIENWWDNIGKPSTKKPKGQGKNAGRR